MKKKKFKNDIVYSTDPNYKVEQEEDSNEIETINPENQKLYIALDRKLRKGKSVTLISNFIGRNEDLRELGKSIKSFCGVGGTVKNGCIEIQGDFRKKIKQFLLDKSFHVVEKG